MWSVYFSVLVIILHVISTTHWIYRWRNPKYNGNLPPGSMGFPYIGETLQFLIPSKSLDIPNFIKKRMRKYDPLSRTSLVGRPVIVSSDPDFNFNLLQQEGKLVERWSWIPLPSFFTKMPHELFRKWFDTQMIFTAKVLFSYESEKSGENIAESFTNFLQGLMSIPLNIPGTAFHRCSKNQKRAIKLITDLLEERRSNPGIREGDFLDQIVEDMQKKFFWTDEFAIYMMFGLLLASFETISSTLALAIKFLTDHPPVVQKLTVEHERILERRKGTDSGLPGKNINP
ncbi:cytochrome P450 87A3-like [Populus alba x Populus x berolinensis]|nr:cytochrome P450 87A3-like [Populus alba x Populus x berolinensis]